MAVSLSKAVVRLLLTCCVLGTWFANNAAHAQESLDDLVPSGYLAAGVFEGRSADDPNLSEPERALWLALSKTYSSLLLGYPISQWQSMPEPLRRQWIENEVGASLLTSQVVVYGRVEEGPEGPLPGFGLRVSRGEFGNFVESQVRLLAAEEGDGLERLRIGEAKIQRTLIDNRFAFTFGWIDDHYYLTIGAPDELEWWLGQRDGQVSEQWAAARERAAVESRLMSLDVDMQKVVALIAATTRSEDAAPIELLGLDSVQAITLQAGFDAQSYVHRIWMDCPEGPRGIFGLFPAAEPSSALTALAADASIVATSGADVMGSLSDLVARISDDQPSAGNELLPRVAEALGNGLLIQHSQQDGGLLAGNSLILPIDNLKLARQLEKEFVDLFEDNQADNDFPWWGPPSIDELEYQGERVYLYSSNGFNPFDSVAWCITDKYLVLAISPLTLKPTIDRLQGNLAAGELQAEPVGLDLRFRMKDALGTPNGFFQFITKVMVHESSWDLRQDLEWNRVASEMVSGFPDSVTLQSVLLDQERITLTSRENGMEIEARMSIPGTEVVALGAAATGTAMLSEQYGLDLQAIFMPAQAAMEMERHNLFMIVLAMHNYHDTYNRFPAQAIVNAEGEPLLSWRVAILPYLEQQALYDQFHKDEPWDSEHNLALVEKMPAIFANPALNLEPGMTNFLGIGGEEGVFPEGDKRIRFADIPDGTSNTLLVYSAPREMAVEWTRPSDMTPDMNLLEQFFGETRESVMAATADGAIHTLGRDITEEKLRGLITRAGREVIEW